MSTDTLNHPGPDPNEVLMGGGGAPTLKLEVQGTVYGGRIVARPTTKPETEFGSQTPKYYPSGDPIYGVVVDVQTNDRDPSIENDDGVRRLYIEGKGKKDAVRKAVQEAGAAGLERGGELYIAWTGYGQAANPGISPPKLYQARYVPVTAAALNTAPAQPAWPQNSAPPPPPPPPPQQHAWPQQQPAPAPTGQPAWSAQPPPQAAPQQPVQVAPPAPGQPTAEQLAGLRNIGWTDDQIRATFPGWQS